MLRLLRLCNLRQLNKTKYAPMVEQEDTTDLSSVPKLK